jgi:hypothetical protein
MAFKDKGICLGYHRDFHMGFAAVCVIINVLSDYMSNHVYN